MIGTETPMCGFVRSVRRFFECEGDAAYVVNAERYNTADHERDSQFISDLSCGQHARAYARVTGTKATRLTPASANEIAAKERNERGDRALARWTMVSPEVRALPFSDMRWSALVGAWNRIACDHLSGFMIVAAGAGDGDPWPRHPSAYAGIEVSDTLRADCRKFLVHECGMVLP